MQMVAIARALLGAPGLMLFDEPSQGLAPKIVDDVLGVIRRLKREGIAAIVVEQNADIALGVADSVVVLSHGQVAWSGEAVALAADPGAQASAARRAAHEHCPRCSRWRASARSTGAACSIARRPSSSTSIMPSPSRRSSA